jgi:hypothetical protein
MGCIPENLAFPALSGPGLLEKGIQTSLLYNSEW